MGYVSVHDLALLQEGDLLDSSLSQMVKRKLLLVAHFVALDGSLEEVGSFKELAKIVQTLAEQQHEQEVSTSRSFIQGYWKLG